nr:aromatic acid exporter family protein [uncultured Romboutsia sp.]
MKLQKIGMRTVKTGIAVSLCTLLAQYLVQNPMFAGVGCVASVQDTVKGSLKLGFNRVKGTMIGGLVGFLCVLIKPGDPILCGLGIMATIYGCTILGINSGIIVSSVTFLSIHLGIIESNPAYYSIHRVMDTSVGVIIGVIINYILARPDYLELTDKNLNNARQIVGESVKSGIINNGDFDRERLRKTISKLESIYPKLVDEMKYTKNQVDIEIIENEISLYKSINHHIKSIQLIDEEICISKDNYLKIKEMYNVDILNWKMDNESSPVFNYHLSKILEEIDTIDNLKSAI